MKKLTYSQKYWWSIIGAYLTSAGVPLVTCAVLFPAKIVNEAHLSIGASLILTAIVCIAVFRKRLKQFCENYTIIMVWAIILLFSIMLDKFVYEMKIVSLVGLVSNAIATPLFKIAEANGEMVKAIKEKRKENEVKIIVGEK